MKIGIDLDGVVFDSEKEFRILSEIYDMKELKQNSKLDNREVSFQRRFDWTDEQSEEFFNKNIKWIIENANVMPGAKRVLKMLKDEGNELIVITARGGKDEEIIDISQNKIKENGMDIFDKYFYAVKNKAEICRNEGIDVMIDDTTQNCIDISNEGIKTLYFRDGASFELAESNLIKTVYNWGEVYRELGKRD